MKKSYLSIFGAVLLLLNGCAATRSVQPAPDLSSLPLAQADMRAFDVGRDENIYSIYSGADSGCFEYLRIN